MINSRGYKGLTLLALPPIVLIIVVITLLAWTVSVCIKFTKGPLSTTALLRQLQKLQAKFVSGKKFDPETERAEMEVLHNNIKTSSDKKLISAHRDLKQLFSSNCQSIQAVLNETNLENRTSWIKLNSLMVEFDNYYFQQPYEPQPVETAHS